jgi:hypothetical protein
MAKLVAFGDSFTWGTNLKDADHKVPNKHQCVPCNYSKNTWPALLADNLKLEYVCRAGQGCGNQTIVRQFFEYLPHINIEDLVIVNWTWINRWDFYDIDVNRWETIRPSGTENSKFKEFYYKYLQSELWDKWESLKNIGLVHRILEQNGIKYISTCIDELVIDTTYHAPDYVKHLQNELVDQITWFNDQGFFEWSKTNNFKISNEWHPLEEAHQAAFEYIRDNHDFTK